MSTPSGRRSNLLLITLILAISVIFEQYFIVPVFPQLGNLGSIRPMIVFLDIPLALPAIDILPVSILFALFYQIAPAAGLLREQAPAPGNPQYPASSASHQISVPSNNQHSFSTPPSNRIWRALTGWWTLLLLLIAGGALFLWFQDLLPRTVSNGIDSFGVRADLTLPYPSGGLIHLHGSVVMLAFSALGILILHRRTATTLVYFPALESTPAAASYAAASHTASSAAASPQNHPLSGSSVSSNGNLFSSTINEVLAAQKAMSMQEVLAAHPEHARYQPKSSTYPPSAPPVASRPSSSPAAIENATALAAPPEKKYKPVTILPGNTKPVTIITSNPKNTSAIPNPEPKSKPTPIITPEPAPTCRLTTPPPIAVVMPRPAPGIGKMHPCYVPGGLKPTPKPGPDFV